MIKKEMVNQILNQQYNKEIIKKNISFIKTHNPALYHSVRLLDLVSPNEYSRYLSNKSISDYEDIVKEAKTIEVVMAKIGSREIAEQIKKMIFNRNR
jgi:hypothetical protein